jgi:hypothetical protein
MLVIVRNEGSVVYGGRNLTADFEQTFDHALRVDRIVETVGEEFVEISIKHRDGYLETVQLDLEFSEHEIDDVLTVALVGFVRWKEGDRGRRKPTVRLGFDAPRSYKLVRDNAIKRTE